MSTNYQYLTLLFIGFKFLWFKDANLIAKQFTNHKQKTINNKLLNNERRN